MTDYADRYWTSRDGLKLHYRDYPGRADRPPVLCLAGLTRNARDFADLAARIAGEWRVLCPDLRGRGDSEYARDAAGYNPAQYLEDLALLLAGEQIGRLVVIGTSLGGFLTLLMAAARPSPIAGVLLNDIGPVIEPSGFERLREYVGQGRSFPTWMHAARALEEIHGDSFPDYRTGDWLALAKRLMTFTPGGRIVFDYDMKIAEPFLQLDPLAPPDDSAMAGLDALAGRPVTIVRGALSDILSEASLADMARRLPAAEIVTVPRAGHAPSLDEPEAVAALGRLLERVAAGP